MSSQMTLTEDAPMILDATCSFMRNWPRFATIRVDRRYFVGPDIAADDCNLPLRAHSVDFLYCDPPHHMRKDPMILPHDMTQFRKAARAHSYDFDSLHESILSRYGVFPTRENWLRYIEGTNKEYHRVLKSTGELYYKITTSATDKRVVKLEELLTGMTNFTVTRDITTPSKARSKSHNTVHWLTMKPKSAAVEMKK